MNNKLISKDKLISFVYKWAKLFIDENALSTGWCSAIDSFFYPVSYVSQGVSRSIGARFCDDHWKIYNYCDEYEKYANIKIFDNHIEFIEDSEFTDFTRDEMYSLYEFLNERIFNKKEKKVEKNVMNDKELISQEELYSLVEEWLKQMLSSLSGVWNSSPSVGGFYWNLVSDVGYRHRIGGSRLIDDHWEIYNDINTEENVNIKVYTDHIEFIEDSRFEDFSKEEMYSLYEFLNNKIFGNTEKIEEENVMNNDKKSDVKNKLFISQPMTGCDDNEIREYRKRVHRIVSIMFDDPNIELIEQFDVDESNVDFSGMNEAQIRMYRLNRSLSMLMDANIVVFAPNWWKSPGCIEEWIQCQLYTSPHIILGSAIEAVDNTLYNAPTTDDYDYNEESRIIETIDTVFKNTKRPSDSIIVETPEIKLSASLTSLKLAENTKSLYNKTTPNDLTDTYACIGFKVQGVNNNNDQTGTFESFINEWLTPDMDINEYMYSIMIHNKLIEIMTNAMKDRYGVGNTKITTYHERGTLTYNATITFEPNDRNVKYTLSSRLRLYRRDNSEYVDATYSIDYCIKDYVGRKRDSVPFVVDYVSSQIAPESDDYISNKCVVDYVGANKISSTERKLFGYINSELKTFINTRDDIFWVKKK